MKSRFIWRLFYVYFSPCLMKPCSNKRLILLGLKDFRQVFDNPDGFKRQTFPLYTQLQVGFFSEAGELTAEATLQFNEICTALYEREIVSSS